MSRSTWAAIGALIAAGAVAQPVMLPAPLAVAALISLALWLARGALQTGQSRQQASMRLAAMLLAAVAVGARGLAAGSPPTQGLPAGDGPWPGVVIAVGSPLDGDQRATLRILGATGPAVSARLPRYPILNAGDEVLVQGVLRPPPDTDYGRYLERTGVAATLRSRTLELVRRPTDPGAALDGLRRSLADAVAMVVPEPEAGLAAGILLGLRDRVDRDLAASYTTAGVSHVVAISGWNIAIVAAIVAALASRLSRRWRVASTLVVVAGYVLLVGTSPSVVRAAIMASIVLLARESGRSGRAATALGLTVVVLLLIEPVMLQDAGFQLSALATAGLLAWSAPLTRWIEHGTSGRLPGWVTEGLGVSLAAQAATLPVVVGTFGRLALVSPLVNLAVAPIVPVAMAGGALALVAGVPALLVGAAPPLGLLGAIGWLPLTAMDRIVTVAAALPMASVDLPQPLDIAAAILTSGALLAVAGRRRIRKLAGHGAVSPLRADTGNRPGRRTLGRPVLALAAAVALLVACWSIAVAQPPGIARLTVLDVGQGDAILVESSRGGRMLVDGGPDPERLLHVLDARLPPWDRRLDLVVATHPHEDHVAGLPVLLDRYRVGEVLLNGLPGTGPGSAALAERLALGRVAHRVLSTGDSIAFDDISFVVLWPDAGSIPATTLDDGSAINNTSLVLLGATAGKRFLLTGDIEVEVETRLVARGIGRVDLLKAGHHGSDTSSTPAFVDALRPAVTVVSVGADNDYGHPSPDVLDRLIAAGSRVVRTDLAGSIEIELASDGLRVRSERAGTPSRAQGEHAEAPPRAHSGTDAGIGDRRRSALGYHRVDANPDSRRGSPTAPPPRSAALVHAAHARRRRDRRLAGAAHPLPGCAHRSPPRRDGRAPPRRRQAAADLGSSERAPPRRRIGCLARADGLRGACAGRPMAPGDPSRRRSCRHGVAIHRHARGAGRRVRRQTGRPASRADGSEVRVMEPTLPNRRASGQRGGHATSVGYAGSGARGT